MRPRPRAGPMLLGECGERGREVAEVLWEEAQAAEVTPSGRNLTAFFQKIPNDLRHKFPPMLGGTLN